MATNSKDTFTERNPYLVYSDEFEDTKTDIMRTFGNMLEDTAITLSSEAVRAFDTVSDMQACTSLIAGMICHTNGFHTAGDGGAAFYKVTATGTANGMDVLACGDLFANLVITESYVTPEMFGAWGDGTHDDTSIVQYAATYALTENIVFKTYKDKNFLVSNTIVFHNQDVEMNAPIVYKGSSIAVKIGDENESVSRKTLRICVDAKQTNFTSGSHGVVMYNVTNSVIYLYSIDSFECGAKLVGYNAGFSYNKIYIDTVRNCKTGIELVSGGSSGWANENLFVGGRFQVDSNATIHNLNTGIKVTSDYNYTTNGLTFICPCIEGALYCFDLDHCRDVYIRDARTEGATYAINFGTSVDNVDINSMYGSVNLNGEIPADVHFVDRFTEKPFRFPFLVYDSGFIPNKAFSNNSWLWIKDMVFLYPSSAANGGLQGKMWHGVKYNDKVDIGSYFVGVFLDTTYAKRFSVNADELDEFCVVLFDNNDAPLSSGITSSSFTIFTEYSLYNSIPYFRTGTESGNRNAATFKVSDDCKKMFIGVSIKASVGNSIRNLKVYSDESKCTECYPVTSILYDGRPFVKGLDAVPTCEGMAGDFCPSAKGTESGWYYNGTVWKAVPFTA